MTTLLVSPKYVADLSIYEVRGMPTHHRQPLPERTGRLSLADQR